LEQAGDCLTHSDRKKCPEHRVAEWPKRKKVGPLYHFASKGVNDKILLVRNINA